jgi:hypothetical protein
MNTERGREDGGFTWSRWWQFIYHKRPMLRSIDTFPNGDVWWIDPPPLVCSGHARGTHPLILYMKAKFIYINWPQASPTCTCVCVTTLLCWRYREKPGCTWKLEKIWHCLAHASLSSETKALKALLASCKITCSSPIQQFVRDRVHIRPTGLNKVWTLRLLIRTDKTCSNNDAGEDKH